MGKPLEEEVRGNLTTIQGEWRNGVSMNWTLGCCDQNILPADGNSGVVLIHEVRIMHQINTDTTTSPR
jgi:hypothetical protein